MEVAPRWIVLTLILLLVAANTFNIAADIAAMAAALSLVIGGLNHEHALIFAATSTLLQVFVPYRRYAPVLKFLTLTLFAYVATAFMVEIPWSTALLATVWPKPTISAEYFLMVVAVLGTTISPYLFFWQASQEVEEVRADPDQGKNAVTYYRVIDSAGEHASWLALLPITGRTHQLRVHCAAIGTPILGDSKYGGAAAQLAGIPNGRQLHLHARELAIPHPHAADR